MSTHGAFVARIKVSPHPNADRLSLGSVGGFQVIVGKDTPDDSIGLFFSSELIISDEFAKANGLYKRDGGYFDNDRARVRSQRFRGEKSDGYFTGLDALEFTGGDWQNLKVGEMITDFNDVPICKKYINPATARAMRNRQPRKALPNFPKHYDTEQLAYYIDHIPTGSVIWITTKLHGTSQRTGMIVDESKIKPKQWWEFWKRSKAPEYELISGTRNVVLGTYEEGESAKNYRFQAADLFKDGLHRNEIAYYEIVGYESEHTPIMSAHNFSNCQDKDLKAWGENVVYNYNCLPGTFDVYLYRMTVMTENLYGQAIQVDLPWPMVKKRAQEIGVKHVPEVDCFVYEDTEDVKANLIAQVDRIIEGGDTQFSNHPVEGVVLHILTPQGKLYALKYKGFTFKIGEGIAKESDEYVDTEEIS